jgi:cytochrome c-type biogenesis protein CcmH
MKGQLPAVAVGAVVALLGVVGVLWLAAPAPSSAERTDALAGELRCPDCQGLSVGDSQTPAAQEIRRQVAALVDAGATDEEVRAHFADRYGDWILLAPAAPALWLVPLAAVLAAALALVVWLRSRDAPAPAPVGAPSEDARRRVRDEAEALDA